MRTRHGQLRAGQNIFSALAYSDDDVLNIGDQFSIAGYKNNPVLLSEHDPNRPIGQVTSLKKAKSGIRVEFAFDTESPEGLEAERKWMRGLRSSLSIGVSGRLKKGKTGTGTYTMGQRDWSLAEISQVSVPLDQRATASPNERGPLRVASLSGLSKLEASEDLHSREDIYVILTASVATAEELSPSLVVDPETPADEEETTVVDPADEKEEDAVNDKKEEEIVANKEDEEKEDEENSPNLSNPISMDEKKIQELTETVNDLKYMNRKLRTDLEGLQESETKKQSTIDELKKENASLHAALKEEKNKAPLDPDHIIAESEKVRERTASLDEKEADLHAREKQVAIDTEISRWRDLLPEGFTGRNCSVREVLEAALPNNLLEPGISDDQIRGMLRMEQSSRLNARIQGNLKTKSAKTKTFSAGYISPQQLQEMEGEFNS